VELARAVRARLRACAARERHIVLDIGHVGIRRIHYESARGRGRQSATPIGRSEGEETVRYQERTGCGRFHQIGRGMERAVTQGRKPDDAVNVVRTRPPGSAGREQDEGRPRVGVKMLRLRRLRGRPRVNGAEDEGRASENKDEDFGWTQFCHNGFPFFRNWLGHDDPILEKAPHTPSRQWTPDIAPSQPSCGRQLSCLSFALPTDLAKTLVSGPL